MEKRNGLRWSDAVIVLVCVTLALSERPANPVFFLRALGIVFADDA